LRGDSALKIDRIVIRNFRGISLLEADQLGEALEIILEEQSLDYGPTKQREFQATDQRAALALLEEIRLLPNR
jgi:hypothetical protein